MLAVTVHCHIKPEFIGGTHTRTYAGTQARRHARTQAGTHARTHARTFIINLRQRIINVSILLNKPKYSLDTITFRCGSKQRIHGGDKCQLSSHDSRQKPTFQLSKNVLMHRPLEALQNRDTCPLKRVPIWWSF